MFYDQVHISLASYHSEKSLLGSISPLIFFAQILNSLIHLDHKMSSQPCRLLKCMPADIYCHIWKSLCYRNGFNTDFIRRHMEIKLGSPNPLQAIPHWAHKSWFSLFQGLHKWWCSTLFACESPGAGSSCLARVMQFSLLQQFCPWLWLCTFWIPGCPWDPSAPFLLWYLIA